MHSEEHNKKVQNRLSRAIGHMNAIKKMVEADRDCSDILIQLAAVRAETEGLSKFIIGEHIDHCMIDAVKNNDYDSLEKLQGAIKQLL